MRFVLALLLLAVPAGTLAQPLPDSTRQLVVVVTPSWSATDGTLQRYERAGPEAPWARVGEPVDVVTGRSGLGWGRGLHGEPPADALQGPVKQEGDGRAPAGAFALTAAFGYAETGETGLPYLHARDGLQCVDDADSRYYNQIVGRWRIPTPDWASHEEMRRRDVLYRRGVVVAHNGGPALDGGAPRPGAGSCIFLHVWRGPGTTTIGCTALEEGALETVVAWLDRTHAPVLVQLPRPAYADWASSWRLPAAF